MKSTSFTYKIIARPERAGGCDVAFLADGVVVHALGFKWFVNPEAPARYMYMQRHRERWPDALPDDVTEQDIYDICRVVSDELKELGFIPH